jgi:pimeloyl-ACP methyl ester carboxylesterase
VGVEREYLVCVPSGAVTSIAVIFHPFGATPELVVHGEEPGDYLITRLEGVLRPADAVGMLVIAPRARGRQVEGVSLAWKPHLDAAFELAKAISKETHTAHIVAGGLSMGGLEALVFAGQHPDEIAAVWAVNPVVDVAEWYSDIEQRRATDSLFDSDAPELIAEEVGGLPADSEEQYRVRSAISYTAELSRTRVSITWSPADTIIPNQATKHAHPLAEAVLALGGDITENIVTHLPADTMLDAGRVAHESCDVWENIGWAVEAIERS